MISAAHQGDTARLGVQPLISWLCAAREERRASRGAPPPPRILPVRRLSISLTTPPLACRWAASGPSPKKLMQRRRWRVTTEPYPHSSARSAPTYPRVRSRAVHSGAASSPKPDTPEPAPAAPKSPAEQPSPVVKELSPAAPKVRQVNLCSHCPRRGSRSAVSRLWLSTRTLSLPPATEGTSTGRRRRWRS